MVRNFLLSLIDEEKFSETVKKYSSLRNNSCKNYGSNSCMRNFWAKVDKKMSLEEFNINTVVSDIGRCFLKTALQ